MPTEQPLVVGHFAEIKIREVRRAAWGVGRRRPCAAAVGRPGHQDGRAGEGTMFVFQNTTISSRAPLWKQSQNNLHLRVDCACGVRSDGFRENFVR
jgi:hypothetical protein